MPDFSHTPPAARGVPSADAAAARTAPRDAVIRIALLTASYPFLPGEQFLEEEILHWTVPGVDLVVMPQTAQGQSRPLPPGVMLDLSLARGRAAASIPACALLALFNPVFWREALQLLRTRRAPLSCLARALQATAGMLRNYRALSPSLQARRFDLVYCYWNDSASLGAALQRRHGRVPRLVTRIHNWELYEEEMPQAYIPLKRQFVADFDCFYAVSRHGQAYLGRVYGVPAARAGLSRLGVTMPALQSPVSPEGQLHVLSVSYCVWYKRVEHIIAALALLARQQPGLRVHWTHIGDGPLLESLRQQAERSFAGTNVRWQLRGHLSNAEVRRHLASQAVDVLINASKNEGVPVSIMEAMSHGVPAVAPRVGGVAELVDDTCGRLLEPEPGAEQLAAALASLKDSVKQPLMRRAAFSKVATQYEAHRNYHHFVGQLLDRAGRAPTAPGHVAPAAAAAGTATAPAATARSKV